MKPNNLILVFLLITSTLAFSQSNNFYLIEPGGGTIAASPQKNINFYDGKIGIGVAQPDRGFLEIAPNTSNYFAISAKGGSQGGDIATRLFEFLSPDFNYYQSGSGLHCQIFASNGTSFNNDVPFINAFKNGKASSGNLALQTNSGFIGIRNAESKTKT